MPNNDGGGGGTFAAPSAKNAETENNSRTPPMRAQHAPLRRVLPKGAGTSTTSVARQHSAQHPLLFASCSLQPNNAPHPPPLPASQRISLPISLQQPGPITTTTTSASGGANSHGSLADSCYSSCSEGDAQQHLLLSRDSSSSGLAEDFQQKATMGEEEEDKQRRMDPGLVEFATRLGYSEHSLRTVLRQLGPNGDIQQDRVLSELIKLGRQQRQQPPSPGNSNSPRQKQSADGGKPKLRPIVVDGSNIAMTHGNKTLFSCRGIRDCVQFFARRGHTDILVFVPQFRREQSRPDAPIADQHILMELEAERRLVWTPSRRVGGRRIVCHDDRYILKTAAEKQAVIVSNDEYRDLVRECPRWRAVVESLLLMYSFVDGQFMPPDDPLGRHGPKLDQFLTFAHTPLNAQLCPYAKKCTYGNKCKYYHPERGNGARVSVTDRLIGGEPGGGIAKQRLAARPSMIAEHSLSLNHQPQRQQQHSPSPLFQLSQHNHVGRTRSLNLPFGTHQPNGGEHAKPQPLFPALAGHSSLLRLESSPTSVASDHQQQHSPLARIVSAPAPATHQHMYSPSPAVWGDCEFSCFGGGATKAAATAHLTPPATLAKDSPEQQRQRLQYHLCQLFPEPAVLAVMAAHPNDTDAQRLCQRIIAFQKGFHEGDGEQGDME